MSSLLLPLVAVAAGAGVGLSLLRRVRGARKWASAGGVVVDEHERVALVKQRDRKNRWRWTLPKGRIDRGESAEEAALREVFEESGLRATIVRPLVLHDGRLHFTYFYEMALVEDHGRHDDETRAVRFVSVVEAARLLTSRRDLAVLRRLVEVRTRVTAV
ncbi:MAG: family hydrolase [bacterium]|nr:family hydrolase [bacterium]